jgi:hypothetical protein
MTHLILAITLLVSPDVAPEPSRDVTVEVVVKKKLRRVSGTLRGRLDVRLHNIRATPLTLLNRDVHGFRFRPARGGPAQLVIHSCDCAFELGTDSPPESRTLTLAPGETRTLEFDDFECSGGPYFTPLPGKYLVTYGIGEPASDSRADGGVSPTCDQLVRTRLHLFESKPLATHIEGR